MKIPKSHDSLFKASMSDLTIAKAFFAQHLSPVIYEQLNFNTLQLKPTHFIKAELQQQTADMLFSINFKDQAALAYLYILVEHQSTIDPSIAWRLLEYTIAIIQLHLKQHQDQTLPVVIPILFYTGDSDYTAPTNIYDLFGEHKELAKQVMFGSYSLINLNDLSDEVIAKHQKTSLMQFVMKHVRDRNFMQLRSIIAKLLQDYFAAKNEVRSQDYDHLLSITYYLLSESDIKSEEQAEFFAIMRDNLPKAVGEKVMSLAQHIEQQGFKAGFEQAQVEMKSLKQQIEQRGYHAGIEQGVLKGEHNFLTKMLKFKFPDAQLSEKYLLKIQQADESQLSLWGQRVLIAQEISDIFNEN